MDMASTPVITWGVPEATFDRRSLPPGFRFRPTDKDLCHFLEGKINNKPIWIKDIVEVKLYDHHPQSLTERYPPLADNAWYFFTPRERKYKNGLRPNRAAGSGHWKATGKDSAIRDREDGPILGYKKTLKFHEGKSPEDKTQWGMHEYTLGKPNESRRGSADMKLDDWVLCRIYLQAQRPMKNKKGKRSDENASSSTAARQDRTPNTEEREVNLAGDNCGATNPLVHNQWSLDQSVPAMENHNLLGLVDNSSYVTDYGMMINNPTNSLYAYYNDPSYFLTNDNNNSERLLLEFGNPQLEQKSPAKPRDDHKDKKPRN